MNQDKALGYFDSTARLNLILLTARFQFSQTHAEADSRKLVDAVVNIDENTNTILSTLMKIPIWMIMVIAFTLYMSRFFLRSSKSSAMLTPRSTLFFSRQFNVFKVSSALIKLAFDLMK